VEASEGMKVRRGSALRDSGNTDPAANGSPGCSNPWSRDQRRVAGAGSFGRERRSSPTVKRQEGTAGRKICRYREGKPSEGRNPRALPARNKAGEVTSGTKRQEAEKA
jgi:hypothetical protein